MKYTSMIGCFLITSNSLNSISRKRVVYVSLTALRYINVKYGFRISHATREFLITNNEIRVPGVTLVT